MTLGEAVVGFAKGAAILGGIYALLRYDVVNPRDAPDLKQIGDALKRGKALSSQWKRVNDENRTGYGILAACFFLMMILVFAGGRLTHFIDQF
jgi:hypothetical protein